MSFISTPYKYHLTLQYKSFMPLSLKAVHNAGMSLTKHVLKQTHSSLK